MIPRVDVEAKKKKKTTILCHDGQTIAVPKKKVRAHLAHGDTLGSCSGEPPCHQIRESCTDACCAGLICEDVDGCGPPDVPNGPYCCAGSGGNCQESCDCCGELQCSERQGNTCRDCGFLLDACDARNGDRGCCLDDLACGSNGCEPDDLCCLGIGGACLDGCDCCAAFGCSERGDFTCQDCQYPGGVCRAENGDDDCCLAESTCADNGCGDEPNAVCCLGEGSACLDPCDCCADFDCVFEDDADFGTCVPFALLRAGADKTGARSPRETAHAHPGKPRRSRRAGSEAGYRRSPARRE